MSSRIMQRNYAIESTSCATESHHRSWSKDWIPKHRDSKSSKRSTVSTRLSEQLGQSKSLFDSGCLCWQKCWYFDIIRKLSCRTSNHSSSITSWEMTLSCFDLESIRCRNQHQSWLQLQVRQKWAYRKIQWQYKILLFQRLLYWLRVHIQQWHSLIMEGPKRGRSRDNYYWQVVPTNSIEKLKNSLQKRSLLFVAISQRRYAMEWWSWGCWKVLTVSATQHL